MPAVVVAFDIPEEFLLDLLAVASPKVHEQFGLEGCGEALGDGVVPAGAPTAHRAYDAARRQ
jgi:hypothetical protein